MMEMTDSKITRRALLGTGVALTSGLIVAEKASALGPKPKRKVVVWSESTAPRDIYPKDINRDIALVLRPLKDFDVDVASIDAPDQGLSQDRLAETSVLVWWGNKRHDEVKDELVERIVKRVKEDGMGFIALHASHNSKPFKSIMGTSCSWKSQVDDGVKVDLIVEATHHPITRGLVPPTRRTLMSGYIPVKSYPPPIEILHTEHYSEPFDVPTPETVIFNGVYMPLDGKEPERGKRYEHARQGMVWTMGKGRIFYFQPGHDKFPIYLQPQVEEILRNSVQWVAR